MKWEELRSPLLALAILAGALVIGWFAAVQPVLDAFSDQREQIARSARHLAVYQAEIDTASKMAAVLREIRAREAVNAGLIPGGNAALAAANMQGIVKSLIESEGGQVRSAQNVAPFSTDGFENIAIQFDTSLPVTRLKDTTYRIETNAPYLFLDDVDIRMPESWQSEGAPNDPPPLDVRWTVRAYRWTRQR